MEASLLLLSFFLFFDSFSLFFPLICRVSVNVYLCDKNQLLNAFKPSVCVLR